MKPDPISIIIRTKNEERWIGYSIQSILKKFHKPEIIIIDNNSTDETLEIVRIFAQDKLLGNTKNKRYTNIKIFKIKDYTPGKSLNLGVKKTTRKFIMIISAHCQLINVNTKELIKNSDKYSCIFGNQKPVFKGKEIEKRYLWEHFHSSKEVNMYSKSEKRYFMHNALAFYKRQTLIQNKFNENLAGKEDRYWANDIIKKNKKVLYDPNFTAFHHYTLNGNTWKGQG